MQKITLKFNDADSKRYKDENGYLTIKDNPIAKAGVFKYKKSEIEGEESLNNDDSIVYVYRPFEDLVEKKEYFSNKPIVYTHQWVGDTINNVAGAIASNIRAEEPYLIADLIIFSKDLIDTIERGEAVELSPGYVADTVLENGVFKGEPFEYKQTLNRVNHLAVVKEGRSGKDLRILDSKEKDGGFSMKKVFMDALSKAFDSVKDKVEVEVKDEREDKRLLIREILAVASKENSSFDGGAKEKEDYITKLLEKLAYDPSTTSKVDDQDSEDDKEVEVLVKEDTENKLRDDDIEKMDVEDVVKLTQLISDLIDAKLQAFKSQEIKVEDSKNRAYDEVSRVVGSFNCNGMDVNSIYAYGYRHLSGRDLGQHLDAKTAFNLKAGESRQVVYDYKSVDNSITDNDLSLLKLIK